MPPKKRSPDDVHDIFSVEVGKPYRGSLVTNIEIETTNLDSGRVKVRRLIHLDDGIVLLEDTWHEHGDVFVDGKLLPYNEISFPSMDPADFAAPVRSKNDDDDDDDDDDEKKKQKRDLLRQKAREMLKQKSRPQHTSTTSSDDTSDADPESDNDDNDNDNDNGNDNDNDDDDDDDDGAAVIRIKVKTPDGRILPVVVKPDDTVGDLKSKINDDYDIPSEEQNLSFHGKPLEDDPSSTLQTHGIKDGDSIDLEEAGRKTPDTNSSSRRNKQALLDSKQQPPKGGTDQTRVLGPGSAWVYPTAASAPREGETKNLLGIWSKPPGKKKNNNKGNGGNDDDPVEVNIHPLHKEPRSEGTSDIHGAYGYANGAKPDRNGVVDPSSVVFYPPGHHKKNHYSPDFEHVGWWSAPESSSVTTVSWRFEGNDCLNVKTHTVNVMGHTMTFVTEWTE